MPTTWNLRLPMVGDGDLERCRLIYEQLLVDANVDRLTIEEQMHDPFVRSMSITFKEGYERPANPTLHALQQQYPADITPVRSLLALNQEVAQWTRQIAQGLQVPEELLDPDRFTGTGQNPCAEIPLAPRPLKPAEVPSWLKPGAWVECGGLIYKLQRIEAIGDNLYAIMRHPEGDEISCVLNSITFSRLTLASGPPPILRTWHDRILDDD